MYRNFIKNLYNGFIILVKIFYLDLSVMWENSLGKYELSELFVLYEFSKRIFIKVRVWGWGGFKGGFEIWRVVF